MKRCIVCLVAAAAAAGGWIAAADVVITSPTGTQDERDVALKAIGKEVRNMPADTVAVTGDIAEFVKDEFRSTAHIVKDAFGGEKPQEAVRDEMLRDVETMWGEPHEIQRRSYTVSAAVGAELSGSGREGATILDVRDFFKGVEFPEGASAYYRPGIRRLIVFSKQASLLAIEEILSGYHRAERDFKQIEINAKFIEVSQSTLNQMGFDWRIENYVSGDAFPIGRHLRLPDNQDVFSAGLRTAAAAFGAGVDAGSSVVLTKDGWMPLRVAIRALEQASDSDVLSAPSLTTKDGKRAEIWVGEDRMVPARFNVNSSDINVRVEHARWDSKMAGVHFSVRPEIRRDNIIRLELTPKVIDLVGYNEWKVSPEASMLMVNGYAPSHLRVQGRFPILKYTKAGISSTWQAMQDALEPIYGPGVDPNDGSVVSGAPGTVYGTPSYTYYDQYRKMEHEEEAVPLAAIYGRLPFFRVREIETKVDVSDGSTVGLGGLIYDRRETYKDKVPVLGSIPLLGRLFRSEGERSIKRNLMIFVSATQVDAGGQRRADIALNK